MTVSVIPNAGTTFTPPSSCSIGGAMAPNTPTSSLFGGIVRPAMVVYTIGKSEMGGRACLGMTPQKRLAENFGCNTMVPPAPRTVVHIDQLWAFTWKNGRNTRYTPPGCIEILVGPTRAAHSALAWVCTTALGREVVPEVNTMPAGAIGSVGRCGQSASSP